MKSTLATFFCAAALAMVATPRAYAALDELESLLTGDPPIAQHEAQSAAVATDSHRAVDASSYNAPQPWHAAAEIGPATGGHAAIAAEHKPAPAPPVNPVPEPSAIILALAALSYFLLFGRRRRVV